MELSQFQCQILAKTEKYTRWLEDKRGAQHFTVDSLQSTTEEINGEWEALGREVSHVGEVAEEVVAAALGNGSDEARQQEMLGVVAWETTLGVEDLSNPQTVASCLTSHVQTYRSSKGMLHAALLKFLNLPHQEVQVGVDDDDEAVQEGISMTAAKAFVEQSTSFGEVDIQWSRQVFMVAISHLKSEMYEADGGFDGLVHIVKHELKPYDSTPEVTRSRLTPLVRIACLPLCCTSFSP